MGPETIKYRKQDKPGINGSFFHISLNVKGLPDMTVLTTSEENGHDLLIWKSSDTLYTARLIVTNRNAFFPPEFLKPGQRLHPVTAGDFPDNIEIV